MPPRRDVSGILRLLREYCLGRKNVNFLRFSDEMSARTQPPPNFPPSANEKLAGNNYYTRDARRTLKPGEVIADGTSTLKLESGTEPPPVIQRTPGQTYMWDIHPWKQNVAKE